MRQAPKRFHRQTYVKFMKIKIHTLVAIVACLTGFNEVFAQGTAFTYQGQLTAGGVPANGSYDMAFSLFSAATGGATSFGPITNAATAITNGMFTVTLDFGDGVFAGANYWLDISVSPAGSNSFTELTPRQAITPTPVRPLLAERRQRSHRDDGQRSGRGFRRKRRATGRAEHSHPGHGINNRDQRIHYGRERDQWRHGLHRRPSSNRERYQRLQCGDHCHGFQRRGGKSHGAKRRQRVFRRGKADNCASAE